MLPPHTDPQSPAAESSSATAQRVIARGVGSNALSFVIRFAARALLLFIGANLFGKAIYGVFTLAVATVELAVPLASLGLKRMIFPWLEEEAPSRGAAHVLFDALVLVALAGSAVATVVVVGSWALPGSLVSDQLRFALMVLAPAVLCQVTSDIALATTRWTHKMRYEVMGRGLVEPYVGSAAALLAWYAGLNTTGLLVGYWAGSIALTVWSLWSARHCIRPMHLRRWRPTRAILQRVPRLLPASGSDLLTSLTQRIDLFLVGLLLGDSAAGVYGVVRQLRTPILQVRQAFDGILVPLIARTMRADGDVVAGEATAAATRVILTAQLVVVLLMVAAGEGLLGLFGPQYVAGYWTLVAMALCETVNGAFGVSELILYYRRPDLALRLNFVLITIAAVLVPLLAPRLGTAGAALSMLVAALAATFLRRKWLHDLHVRRTRLHAAPPLIAGAVGGIAGLVAFETLELLFSIERWAEQIAAPVLALVVYGVLIWLWTRARPGTLSLAKFRVAA